MPNFWKIVCWSCGINAELYQDKHTRTMCLSCLDGHEFKEVGSTMEDFDDSAEKVEEIPREESGDVLRDFDKDWPGYSDGLPELNGVPECE